MTSVNNSHPKTCDIFCAVVDNFGDIGVSWRLARQLVHEHGIHVRLWVDDLHSFAKLCPEANAALDEQSCRGIEVRHWTKDWPEVKPVELVIEAFACKLPETYIEAMAAQESKPVWLNLEYLSAEDWVEGAHKLPSPHLRLPLVKYFFFPGFTAKTGGLLLEQDLLARRDAFQADRASPSPAHPRREREFWRSMGMPERVAGELRVSLFSYENDAVAGLLDAWAQSSMPVVCCVPEGRVLPQVAAFFGEASFDQLRTNGMNSDNPLASKPLQLPLVRGRPETAPPLTRGGWEGFGSNKPSGIKTWQRGNLRVYVLPFVEQERYDELLWACDINFVRGEDSCVRAQWAAKPFVWHIYPQHDGVHMQKLRALSGLYGRGLPAQAHQANENLWLAWNGEGDIASAWQEYAAQRVELARYALAWSAKLAGNNLALNLLDFSCQVGRIRAFEI